MALRKEEGADLRKRYPIYVEVGMVAALLLLILAFRIDLGPGESQSFEMPEQETVQLEEVQQTQQEMEPPPPPRPPVPVEVPNDQVLEDEALDLDASLDLDEALDENEAPPPPEEEEGPGEDEVFMVVEDQPQLIGGLSELQQQVEYPEFAAKAGIEGRVFVQFIVDKNGNVVDPTVLRSPHKLLSEEALRVIQLAKFEPGRQRGNAVNVKMSLPITFRLQ